MSLAVLRPCCSPASGGLSRTVWKAVSCGDENRVGFLVRRSWILVPDALAGLVQADSLAWSWPVNRRHRSIKSRRTQAVIAFFRAGRPALLSGPRMAANFTKPRHSGWNLRSLHTSSAHERSQVGIATAVDPAALLLHTAAAVFAGTRTNKTAGLLAVVEAVPVADAAIQYGAGQCTHAVRVAMSAPVAGVGATVMGSCPPLATGLLAATLLAAGFEAGSSFGHRLSHRLLHLRQLLGMVSGSRRSSMLSCQARSCTMMARMGSSMVSSQAWSGCWLKRLRTLGHATRVHQRGGRSCTSCCCMRDQPWRWRRPMLPRA